MRNHDLAVIGGGPGGLATAMYAGLRGLTAVVYEAETFGGQLVNLYPSKPVTNFPAQDEVLSRDLALRLAEQADRFGAELCEHAPVEDVAPADGRGYVVTAGGEESSAQAVVLALGLGRFAPRRLGVPGEERFLGKGVAYRLPPVEQIRAERIVVVGGGDTALDTALALSRIAQVTLVHRRDEFSGYSHTVARLDEAGLDVIRRGEVTELLGGDRLEGVVVSGHDGMRLELPTDLLLVSIGQVPDMEGVAAWRIGIDGPHLSVDSAMQSSRRGLLAVGDFATYPGKVKMITTAVAEGSTAAASVERQLMTAA